MGVMNVWFQGLQNVLPIESTAAFRRGGRTKLVAYVNAVTLQWGVPGYRYQHWHRTLRPYSAPSCLRSGLLECPKCARMLFPASPITFATLPVSVGLRTLEDTRPIFIAFAAAAVSAVTFSIGGGLIGSITICAAGAMFTRSLQLFILKRAFNIRISQQ